MHTKNCEAATECVRTMRVPVCVPKNCEGATECVWRTVRVPVGEPEGL